MFAVTVGCWLLAGTVAAESAPAGAPAAAPAPTPANDEFHFVVLGDSQFDDPATFNRMVDDVRHLQPAFVVQVGDMIDGYSNNVQTVAEEWDRFATQIAPLGDIAYVPVPGNHDLYNAFRRADHRLEALYRERWGPTYHSFDYRNARFVILNSDAPDEERQIGPKQFEWLEATLADADDVGVEHIFVFVHRPPHGFTNAQALHALLREYPVRYVFYGHQHHYHYSERDGIGYVMTNAAGDSGTPHPAVGSYDHFLHVSVRDASVGFATIQADAIHGPDHVAPQDNYDLYDLTNKLAPGEVPLMASGDQWLMAIPLTNPTTRTLRVYTQCRSVDERWSHEPQQIPVIELDADGRDELRLSWRARHSEFTPLCELMVPFQTQSGRWLRHAMTVRSVIDDAP